MQLNRRLIKSKESAWTRGYCRKLAFENLENRALLANNSGPALQLDGTDNYARAADHASLDLGIGSGEDFTIETSFYVSNPLRKTNQFLIVKDNAYEIFFNENGLFAELTFNSFGQGIQLFRPQALSIGWHHVAAVFDNEFTANQDRFALYFDGNLGASTSSFDVTPGINNSTSALHLGAYFGAVPFDGLMDETRFSDTVRYSGSTYVVPTTPFTVDGNTRALWHFDEPVGSVVFSDSSSNGNTLTGLNGAQTANFPLPPVNNSPTLSTAPSPTLTAQNEDSGAPAGAVGTLVSALVDLNPPAGGLDNVTDVDSSPATGIALTAANTTNGTWFYSINNGTDWTPLGVPSVTASRLLFADANTRLYFQPNANFNGTISTAITFRAYDQTSGTNGGTDDTSTNGGSTAFSTATDTASLVITAINDAPVLSTSPSPALTAQNEDVGAPTGAVGTLVSALVNLNPPAGGLDNITDADAGAVTGIAVTAADATNGAWFYSTNNGTAWNALGVPSETASRLLFADTNTRLYFRPNADFNGTINSAITFRAYDRTSGTNGGTDDTSTNGGSTAFSTANDTASLVITAINDAPVLSTSPSPALTAQNEDAGAPTGAVGTLVSTLVDLNPPDGELDNVTDADAGAATGIAVIAADATNGTWFYSTNNGTAWNALGVPSGTASRLLFADANTRLYFRPNADFNGTINSAITFRAYDRTSGTNGGTANTSTNGGSTAFSTATDTASLVITATNAAPTATNLSAAENYTEDSSLNLTNIVVSDADNDGVTATLTLSNPSAGSLSTATSGTVTSTYDAGTGVWTATGAITDVNTLLAEVMFISALNFNENFSISTSVSDGVAPAVTGSKVMTGTPMNDAPVLSTSPSPAFAAQNEDDGAPTGAVGTLVSALVDLNPPAGDLDNVTDVDSGAVAGIAVTAANATNGTWFYSINNGTDWNALGVPSEMASRLLAADANSRLYFQPNAEFNGTIESAITFRAWDQSSGANGDVADASNNGATTAFSAATDTASLVINDVGPALLGDYNENNFVDSADYVIWRKTFGQSDLTPYSGADGSGDSMIDDDDYIVWRSQFGGPLSPGSGVESATASAAPVAPVDQSMGAGTSTSLSGAKPHETVRSQRTGGDEEAVGQHKNPAPVFASASSSPYRPAMRLSLEIQEALPAAGRDEALVAWLSSRRDTDKHLDDVSSAEKCTREEVGYADDLHVNSVEWIFALFASS